MRLSFNCRPEFFAFLIWRLDLAMFGAPRELQKKGVTDVRDASSKAPSQASVARGQIFRGRR